MKSLVIGTIVLTFAGAIGTLGWFATSRPEGSTLHLRSVVAVFTPTVPERHFPAGPGEGLLARENRPPATDDGAPVGRTDGFIADGESISPFDSSHPAIANLSLQLRDAMVAASEAAAIDGVDVRITSGWRSAHYQQTLLDEAIATHGSESEARRWVNTPEDSTHVTGDAIDIGNEDAMDWLRTHGAQFGLCQVFANEPWHFELLTAPGDPCPDLLSDASEGGVGHGHSWPHQR